MKNIAIIVLAAGSSSRMKTIKQLEKIDGKTLLEITLEKVKYLQSEHIFCVLGANAELIKANISSKNVQFIFNKRFTCGLSSSIVSAIDFLKKENQFFDGYFVVLADQPNIETQYLQDIIDLFNENPNKIVASNYGNNYGVPAIIPSKFINELLVLQGDKGAKEFINSNKKHVIIPKNTTNFFDVDTQEDLNFLKKEFRMK